VNHSGLVIRTQRNLGDNRLIYFRPSNIEILPKRQVIGMDTWSSVRSIQLPTPTLSSEANKMVLRLPSYEGTL